MRAVAFQWMRRGLSPGRYGRTPANSAGSSGNPAAARWSGCQRERGSPRRSGRERGAMVSSACAASWPVAAMPANRSAVVTSMGPKATRPRRSAWSWKCRVSRSNGSSVKPLRSDAWPLASVRMASGWSNVTGSLSMSLVVAQPSGSHERFQALTRMPTRSPQTARSVLSSRRISSPLRPRRSHASRTSPSRATRSPSGHEGRDLEHGADHDDPEAQQPDATRAAPDLPAARHVGGRDHACPTTACPMGGTGVAARTCARTWSDCSPRSWRSTSSTRRWATTGTKTSRTSSGST